MLNFIYECSKNNRRELMYGEFVCEKEFDYILIDNMIYECINS